MACLNWPIDLPKRVSPKQRETEKPGDRHGVSENASATEPTRLLAVFVVDTSETELTYPMRE
jgi:hypothetical protein